MIEEPFSQNTESFANEQVCPAVKKLRRLGSIQIAIGYSLAALSAVFGILDAVQTNRATKCITYNDLCYDYSLVFDVACLFSSGCKISFIVCSIIGAFLFYPTILGRSFRAAIFRDDINYDKTSVWSFATVALSNVAFVMALVSAVCCCSVKLVDTTVPVQEF